MVRNNGDAVYEGFVTACVVVPDVKPGNPRYNATNLYKAISDAQEAGAKLICAPELSITGYTCGSLFLQDVLLDEALAALRVLVKCSEKSDALIFVGLPLRHEGKLYDVAAAISGGRLLGLVPKSWLANHDGADESRFFSPAPPQVEEYLFNGQPVLFGADLLFQCAEFPEFTVAAEIGGDLWAPLPPSTSHTRSGATVVVNLSAESETIGKEDCRRLFVRSQSGRAVCAYLYANAGYGESTSDTVYSGHSLIYENARVLAERGSFQSGGAITDLDIGGLVHDRQRLGTFTRSPRPVHKTIVFSQRQDCALPYRRIDPHPFVPSGPIRRAARCEEVLRIQTAGLLQRIIHTNAAKVVIGLSGGLDSTLALLVAARAIRMLGRSGEDILAVSMPGPGTSEDTKRNAELLAAGIGVGFREIGIDYSVRQHLRDIGHPEEDHSVVYENAQARIRTLILMDLANKYGGIVIGTGDLSELALGWMTYNGDHMSMYGVNAGVPKTLIRHIVHHIADKEPSLAEVLRAILATPISPELLPPEDGHISQKTEYLLGSYELHDFFLYHAVRLGRKPTLIFKLAAKAFVGKYGREEILAVMRTFYKRFFTNQFKRNTLPDGPKVGSVALSPTDWPMPSDADGEPWIL